MKTTRTFFLIVFWVSTTITPLLAQWVQTNGRTYSGNILALAVSGTNLFAGTSSGGVFLSTNNGTSWTAVSTGLTNGFIWSLAVSGTNLFAGTFGSGVFLSTNSGTSWTAVNNGLTSTSVSSLAVSGTNLFVGTGPNVRAGTGGGGVFLSTNNGTSWTAVSTGLTDPYVPTLAVSGTNLFTGTFGGGIFLSTNNGTSWRAVNTGLTDPYVYALAVGPAEGGTGGTNLFAGAEFGVWRRPLSQMITSVEGPSTNLPAHFSLSQNYPNPFNPTTTISFALSSRSFVSLKVFDALGREVATLISQELSAGNYGQQWNAEGLPSGVYFYRMSAQTLSGGQAGSFIETKKLILMK
jgi:hypothetical protein